MRKQILNFTLWFFVLIVSCLSSCKQEETFVDVDGQNPIMELTADHIRTECGKQFTLTGKISDKDGLKSIQLLCLGLDLDKTIDLLAIYDETKYEYELSYKFTMPEKLSADEFIIKVIVTDLGGRSTEQSVRITPDGDSTAPVISDVNPADQIVYVLLAENNVHNLSFKVTDDKGLDYVSIAIPELNVDETELFESEIVKELNVVKSYNLPLENKEYNVEIKAADLLGNTQSYTYKIIASNTIDYDQMYMVDFVDNDELALYAFGAHVTMIRKEAYTYTATYYSQGNAQLRFTVSNTNFDMCYGESKTSSGTLTMDDADMQPITIQGTGYYDITIDVLNLTYSISEHAANITDYGQLTVYGGGFMNMTWSDSSPTTLAQDAEVKSLYSADLQTDDAQGGYYYFGITDSGWAHGWKYYDDIKKFASMNDFSKGEMIGGYLPGYGTYNLEFDTYLERGSLKRINQ